MSILKKLLKKDALISILMSVALLVGAFTLAFQFVDPAPPKTLSISAGSTEGAYYSYALKYKEHLAKQGITLEIHSSAGATENLQRLLSEEVDLAFVQGGLAKEDSPLQSLGSLYFEPVWIFHQQTLAIKHLSALKGKKVAIGPDGSGTASLARVLLHDNQLNASNVALLNDTGSTAARKLMAGEIDAAFFIGSVESPIIRQLIQSPLISLASLKRSEAYSRLHPFLAKVTLPEGIIDLQKNIPSSDKQLLAPTANLLSNSNLHPALSVLVLQAMQASHQASGAFSHVNEFPNANKLTAPLSDVAKRFYKNGPPLLMRYLPFEAAIMIDRFMVMMIPLIMLLIPLFKVMPPLYRWRVSSRIYRWYETLQVLDKKVHQQPLTASTKKQLAQELAHIENEVHKVKTPLSYAEKTYQLLSHIELVRQKLNRDR